MRHPPDHAVTAEASGAVASGDALHKDGEPEDLPPLMHDSMPDSQPWQRMAAPLCRCSQHSPPLPTLAAGGKARSSQRHGHGAHLLHRSRPGGRHCGWSAGVHCQGGRHCQHRVPAHRLHGEGGGGGFTASRQADAARRPLQYGAGAKSHQRSTRSHRGGSPGRPRGPGVQHRRLSRPVPRPRVPCRRRRPTRWQ